MFPFSGRSGSWSLCRGGRRCANGVEFVLVLRILRWIIQIHVLDRISFNDRAQTKRYAGVSSSFDLCFRCLHAGAYQWVFALGFTLFFSLFCCFSSFCFCLRSSNFLTFFAGEPNSRGAWNDDAVRNAQPHRGRVSFSLITTPCGNSGLRRQIGVY